MVDFERLAADGFKLLGGRLYDRYGCVVEYSCDVREFGWGSPCNEYHFTDYALSEYSIVKATQYDEWYLKKGYMEICRLRHLGGKNWETF